MTSNECDIRSVHWITATLEVKGGGEGGSSEFRGSVGIRISGDSERSIGVSCGTTHIKKAVRFLLLPTVPLPIGASVIVLADG